MYIIEVLWAVSGCLSRIKIERRKTDDQDKDADRRQVMCSHVLLSVGYRSGPLHPSLYSLSSSLGSLSMVKTSSQVRVCAPEDRGSNLRDYPQPLPAHCYGSGQNRSKATVCPSEQCPALCPRSHKSLSLAKLTWKF